MLIKLNWLIGSNILSLAIFDLDNTLIADDSDHAWGEFLCEKGEVDIEAYRWANDHFYKEYQNNTLDIFEYLEFALSPMAQINKQKLLSLRDEFMQQKIEPILLPLGQQLLAEHRNRGDYLLIITATNRFITEPIAQRLEVDALIATELEEKEGLYTGKVAGTPSFQEGKVTRLHHWLKDNDFELAGSYFYSDSSNDLPLLKQVDNPVAVNPDIALEAYAQEHKWKILNLRN